MGKKYPHVLHEWTGAQGTPLRIVAIRETCHFLEEKIRTDHMGIKSWGARNSALNLQDTIALINSLKEDS